MYRSTVADHRVTDLSMTSLNGEVTCRPFPPTEDQKPKNNLLSISDRTEQREVIRIDEIAVICGTWGGGREDIVVVVVVG